MNRSKLIAVDVDLTVVDSLTPWLKWFESETGCKVSNLDGEYDLVPEMRRLTESTGHNLDPFSYWQREDLYDNLLPLEGSAEKLKSLYFAGHSIVFVSLCEPEHIKSKMRFIEKYFPYSSGFIATSEKHLVDYDVLIDDKELHHMLGAKYRPTSIHILLSQVARKTVKYSNNLAEAGIEIVDNWKDVIL